MTEIDTMMDRLDKLDAERAALRHDLRKSLAIKLLWPDAFEHGQCSSQVKGNLRNKTLPLTFTLKLGNGEERSVPLEEVPPILWPKKLKEEINKLGFMSGNRFFRILKEEEINATNTT
jgi:hypothetical protein